MSSDEDPPPENVGPPRGNPVPRRVLLVDDHEDARSLLAELLDVHGHDVRVAGDATDALAMLASFTPDVALIDIGLPGMNGYDLAAAIRQTPDGAGMRLVALSGFASGNRPEPSVFDAHLLKPTTMRDILSVLAPRG
jgi:CheY-like chemotaxis protein